MPRNSRPSRCEQIRRLQILIAFVVMSIAAQVLVRTAIAADTATSGDEGTDLRSQLLMRQPNVDLPPRALPLNDVARSYRESGLKKGRDGDYAAAERFLLLALDRTRPFDDDAGRAFLLHDLAVLYVFSDKPAKAESAAKESIVFHLRSRNGELWSAIVKQNLAYIYLMQGKPGDAETSLRDAVDIFKRWRGEHEPSTVAMNRVLGNFLFAQHKWQQAEPILRDVLPQQELLAGRYHIETLRTAFRLGVTLRFLKQQRDALTYLTTAVEHWPPEYRLRSLDFATASFNLGTLLAETGREEEGRTHIQRAAEILQRIGDLAQSPLFVPDPPPAADPEDSRLVPAVQ